MFGYSLLPPSVSDRPRQAVIECNPVKLAGKIAVAHALRQPLECFHKRLFDHRTGHVRTAKQISQAVVELVLISGDELAISGMIATQAFCDELPILAHVRSLHDRRR